MNDGSVLAEEWREPSSRSGLIGNALGNRIQRPEVNCGGEDRAISIADYTAMRRESEVGTNLTRCEIQKVAPTDRLPIADACGQDDGRKRKEPKDNAKSARRNALQLYPPVPKGAGRPLPSDDLPNPRCLPSSGKFLRRNDRHGSRTNEAKLHSVGLDSRG